MAWFGVDSNDTAWLNPTELQKIPSWEQNTELQERISGVNMYM